MSIQSLTSLCGNNLDVGLNSCDFNFKKLLSFSEKKPKLFKKLFDTLKPTEAPLFIGLVHLVSQWNNPDLKDRQKYFQLFTENVLNKLTITHSGFAWMTLLCECMLNRKDDDQLLLELLDLFFANADTASGEALVAIERLLIHSCLENHPKVLRYLFEKKVNGAHVNAGIESSPSHLTLLHHAARGGHLEIAKLLIERGADVHAKTTLGETPLHSACDKGHLELIKLLLKNGADINAEDNLNFTPLKNACTGGHTEIAQYLFENKAVLTDIQGALNEACRKGNLNMVKLLIEKGADVNAAPDSAFFDAFEMPLHHACAHGHLEVVQFLISNKADIHAQTPNKKITALHAACEGDKFQIVELLIQEGAQVNIKNANGTTPLHTACTNSIPIAEFLLEKWAEVNAKNNELITPLHNACLYGNLRMVKLLIQYGAEIDAKSISQDTPLQFACSSGYLEIAQFLIEKKASIKTRNSAEFTLLHSACICNYLPIVEYILKLDGDVNPINQWGNTPLHYACNKGYLEIAKLLLNNGANVNAKAKDHQTPLFSACRRGDQEIVKLLLENGADVNAEIPETQETALYSACTYAKIDTVKLLLEQKSLNPKILLRLIEDNKSYIKPDIALLLIDKAKSLFTFPELYLLQTELVKNLLLLQKEEEAKKTIEAWFESKDCSHFLEISLKKENKKIADFLTEQFPDKLKDYLQNIRLSSDDKLRVLSLLSPTEIRETIRTLSEDKKEELLCQVIDLDGVKSIMQILLGLRDEFLNKINWDNFNKINPDSQRLTDAEKDLLERGNTALLTSAEYLSKIPSSCLAVATSTLQYQPIILSCLSVIGGRELCVVIPQLSKFIFVTALPNLKRQLQRACLNVATPMQKRAYLANLLFPTLKEGQELLKQTLDVTILRPKIAKILPLLKQDLAFLQQLLKVLGHDETIEEHSNVMTKLIKDLESLSTHIQKITDHEKEQELPLDYLCTITQSFAVDPVFCNKLYTYDRASLAQCTICPMTRLPIKIEETYYLLEHFKRGKEPTQELIDQNYADLKRIQEAMGKEGIDVTKKIDETKEKLAELTRKLDKQEEI